MPILRPDGSVRPVPASGFLLVLAALTFAGCASPGTPKSPSLHLPEVVSSLAAERIGDEIKLRWTTPAKTTDGLDLNGVTIAQLCRRVATAKPKPEETCSPVRRVRVTPGPSEMADPLPAALLDDPGQVLEYRVELLNAHERSAGPSPPAFAAAGPPPPQIAKLRVEPTAQGALVRWEPTDSADSVELDRVHLPSIPKSQTNPAKKSSTSPSAQEQPEVHLRAPAEDPGGSPFHSDPGGMIDATARRGERFVYTAQRVRRVMLEGHALELRSAVSSPVTVVMADSFPPQPPSGVEATVAEIAGVLAIDLSWRPNTEDDLAGYLVYRVDPNSGASNNRLTRSPIVEPTFHDATVVPGRRYRYTVLAVDATGNQSLPSIPAEEQTPTP